MAIVSGCSAAPVFQLAEHALDDIAASMGHPIVRVRCPSGGGRLDDGFDLSSLAPSAQTVGIIGLVCKQSFGLGHCAHERDSHGDVGDVAGRQGEGDRSAAIIGQSMDFTRSSAVRAPNRFRLLPLFEPAAERCART